MAAITTALTAAAAVVGVGTSLYGLSQKKEGNDAAAAASAAQARQAAEQSRISGLQAQLQSQYAISQSDTTAQYQTGIAQRSAAFSEQETALNIELQDASVSASAQSNALTIANIQLQRQIEGKRQTAMELDARRKQMENLRQTQRARSLALASATGSGAQFSSGLQGGYGQISGQSNTNASGIRQNLELGRDIFNINAGISDNQIAASNLNLSYATQRSNLATRDAQLKNLYSQLQAGAQTDYTSKQAAATSSFSAANAGLQTQYAAAGGQIATQQGNIAAAQGQAAFGSSLFAAGPSIFSAGAGFANMAPSLFNTPVTPTADAIGNSNYP